MNYTAHKIASRRPSFRASLCRKPSVFIWRYLYILLFSFFCFVGIAVELATRQMFAVQGFWGGLLCFSIGFLFSLLCNFKLNFRIDSNKFWKTAWVCGLISLAGCVLSLLAGAWMECRIAVPYPVLRISASAFLALLTYAFLLVVTPKGVIKNFGLAVYAVVDAPLDDLFERIGDHCDHIHIDLVDDTVKHDALTVDLEVISRAREIWAWQPFMLHIMSRKPREWVDKCIDGVDVILVHIDGEDDVMDIISQCRLHGKQAGVVAHHSVALSEVIPYLPHVDFVLVLGIEKPGYSGQLMVPTALGLADTLQSMSGRYGFRLIFDGGVTMENSGRIRSEYIVSSSTVLRAWNPVYACLAIKSGVINAKR
jgi:ribulose-phosphate 3-epimerase